ncbi:MAG: hypothetical protein JW744_01175 [Candidatus Diapherotrites archaeon]|uniref:non-specific serine/threonine protein kinase n=1 Tax=Candidatus Iainarchaeum sp. TaxID=3101447 RepID=A0A938YQL7_9ARCH|nr:hypothetical protein [Candidatus Diapherotrites archaeon]
MLARASSFAGEKGLEIIEQLGKGHSSLVYLAMSGRKRLVLKAERQDSSRFRMAEREAENLRRANEIGIGPKLAGFDFEKRIILMEFVEGKTFSEWLFSNPERKELMEFARELLAQGKRLDEIGLDHGQLAGRGKNILVRNGKPVIIDFEKASSRRKCHNFSVLQAFLFRNPNGAIAARVKEILGEEAEKLTS